MGETYRSFFSDGYPMEMIGVITGSAVASRFPDIPGKVFRLKPTATNLGSFFIGTLSGTNQQYFELDAGDDSGFFKTSTDNLNTFFFYNPSGSSETMAYWTQK